MISYHGRGKGGEGGLITVLEKDKSSFGFRMVHSKSGSYTFRVLPNSNLYPTKKLADVKS